MKNNESIDKNSEEVNSWSEMMAPEDDARWYARQACDTQKAFKSRIQKINESNEKMSQKEFEKWEDEYKEDYDKATKKLYSVNSNFGTYCDVMKETVAYPGYAQEELLHDTIEARAGEYYYERKDALKNAIDSADISDEEKKGYLEKMDDFVASVFKHIDFKYITREEQLDYGSERYDDDRTRAHNAAIRNLNTINDVARKFKVRPFTARNFSPSDVVSRNRQTPAQATIFRYDRDIVEEYYAIAFSDRVNQAKRRLERDMRFGF